MSTQQISIKRVHGDIVGGPSKFELMLALFDRKPVNTRDVEFKVGHGGQGWLIVITDMGVEDGSGESWLFKGQLRNIAGNTSRLPPPSRNVQGWYRTDTRKGWIKLLD